MTAADSARDSVRMRRAFGEFARLAGEAFRGHSAPIAADIAGEFLRAADANRLRGADDRAFSRFPPASRELRAAIAQCFASPPAECSPLFAAAARLSPFLYWRAAGGGIAPVAAAELAGPAGVRECPHFRAGLLFQPPEMFYRWHRHAAEEIYLQFCGKAEWRAEGETSAVVSPPQFILHRAWQAHAIQTFAAPLCAVWGWRGDIAMEHYEFCSAPTE